MRCNVDSGIRPSEVNPSSKVRSEMQRGACTAVTTYLAVFRPLVTIFHFSEPIPLQWKCVDISRVRAHRIVLYAASSYFRALLSGPWANVNQETHTVGEISGHTLNAIVSYCYTGRIDIDADNIYEIAVNASMMNLVKLESWCEQYLANSMRLMNCVDLIQFGELYNMRHLKAKGIEMALLQFQHLMKFDEFLEMRVESLEELLASDHLFVYSEEVAYDAAIQWIRHDATNRKQFFARLVLLVRLEQIKSPVSCVSAEENCGTVRDVYKSQSFSLIICFSLCSTMYVSIPFH